MRETPCSVELDEVTRWLADRAADAPQNFLHLLRLLEAERAWAVGDFQGCVRGFDAALHGAGQRPRPWHRALITERAARFYLAHGLDHNGYELLTQTRQQYAAWGATAKVAQLDWAYPSLPPHQDTSAAQRNTRSPDDSAWQWQCQHRNHRSAGHPVDVTGAELGNQHRRIACPGGAGTRRHDRRHRCSSAGVERRTPPLAAPSDRPRRWRVDERHSSDVGAALPRTHARATGRARRHP